MIDAALLLGSGGYVPTGTRETCCALVRRDDRALVIDAGTGLRRLVTDPALLDGVRAVDLVLTHFHLDHVVGLAYLGAVEGPELTIWGPGLALYETPTARVLEGLVHEPLMPSSLGSLVRGVEELPLGRVELGPFELRTRAQRRHSHPTMALRIGDDLAYCTDTAHDAGNVELASGARVLCHDAWFDEGSPVNRESHSSGREAGRIAADAGAGALVLIHLNPVRRSQQEVLEEARREHGATVLGEDLLALDALAAR